MFSIAFRRLCFWRCTFVCSVYCISGSCRSLCYFFFLYIIFFRCFVIRSSPFSVFKVLVLTFLIMMLFLVRTVWMCIMVTMAIAMTAVMTTQLLVRILTVLISTWIFLRCFICMWILRISWWWISFSCFRFWTAFRFWTLFFRKNSQIWRRYIKVINRPSFYR